jgi:hypothetical protein
MDQSHDKNLDDLALAEPVDGRTDSHLRDVVEHGIYMQQSGNTVAAVEFLKARDVDLKVIRRVLLEPQRRRRLNS